MAGILALGVIVVLLAFLIAVAAKKPAAERPTMYWPLVFVTGCCAVVVLSVW